MDRSRRHQIPLADAPVAVRIILGLGLLAMCLWLPAFLALFH